VGYERSENFVGSKNISEDKVATYQRPETLKLNQWGLAGNWLIEGERAILKGASGKIVFRFHARDLHLVLGSPGRPISFRVKIDGQEPGQNHGVDIDEQGYGKVESHRLYQLIRQQGDGTKRDHTFEIEFSSPGVEAYAFTFG
jgi:hypothetical protein